MKPKKVRLHYWSHRGRHRHPTTLLHRLGTAVVLPLGLVVLACFLATGALFVPTPYSVTASTLLSALGASLMRLMVAYIFALIVGVALGMLAERGRRIESALLPIFDVLESMPVLAFFPVIIILFLRANLLEGAAIFIIFFSMVWNIAFSVVGGLKQTPADVRAIGKVFELTYWQRFWKILLPAIFPAILTGSILSFADGWNIVIVAEALKAYAPNAASAHDLFGIGSILVRSSTNGDTSTLIAAMTLLVIAVVLVNVAVWQPLLAYAERFKFE
ncbi:MAG: ABC transporter permease subunit [Patescibacteria group bacterium]